MDQFDSSCAATTRSIVKSNTTKAHKFAKATMVKGKNLRGKNLPGKNLPGKNLRGK